MTQREINWNITARRWRRDQREQKVFNVFGWACVTSLFLPLIVAIVLYFVYCLIEKEKTIFYDGMPRSGDY
jgi:hypothetical protein